jgi:hypothetical protein
VPIYNPEKVTLSWGGVAARAVANGEMFNFTFNNDLVNTYPSIKGGGRFIKSLDESGTCVVSLQDGSPTKAAWQALYETGQAYPLLLVDRNATGEVAGTKEAMLARPPAMVKSQEMVIVQYTFKFIKGYIVHVGDLLD